MKKPKPGVSPNPLVTGGKTLPKLSGPVGGMPKKPVGPTRLTPRPLPPGRSASAGGLVGGMPKAGMGGLLGAAPKMTAAPKRSTPTPPQVVRAADMKARMSGTPKPLIRSTPKPAMPGRKK